MTAPQGERGVRFEEVRHAAGWVRAGLVLLGAACAATVLVAGWVDPSAPGRVATALVALSVLALMAGLARIASVVRADDDGLGLAFRLGVTVWRQHLAWSEVLVGGVRPVTPGQTFGLGTRRVGPGRVALVARHGLAVSVSAPSGVVYLLVTDRPEELQAALRAGVASAAITRTEESGDEW